MKIKVSISVEMQTMKKVEERLKEGLFRNKSHLIEYAVRRYLDGEN